MIHVQIASQLTAQGVSGVRWVLMEPVDLGQTAAAPAAVLADMASASAAQPPAQPVGSATAGTLRLGALKLLVVGLGLGAALWTAHVQVGPPGAAADLPPATTPAMPALAAPRHLGATPIAPPSPETRALPTAPGAATPASGASAALPPRLTAAL